MKNNFQEINDKHKEDESPVDPLDTLELMDDITTIPAQIGGKIIDVISEKGRDISSAIDNIEISETLTSAAGTLGEYAGDVLDGVGNVAGGIVDVAGDLLSNIDL